MRAPDPENLFLGAGEVFFDRFDATGKSTGLRHLGNVDAFSWNSTTETLQKKSSMSGARGILREVITSSVVEISLNLNEYTSDNLALALLGNESAFTQAANAALVDGAINGGAAIELDKWYDLGPINPTVTSIKQGATVLDAQAYELKQDVGMVRFKSEYAGANKATAAIATWNGSIPAIAASDGKRVVHALASGKVLGHLRYVSAADQVSGPRVKVDIWSVNLKPDGDTPLIGEDFAAFKLKGAAQADGSKPAGTEYMQVLYL